MMCALKPIVNTLEESVDLFSMCELVLIRRKGPPICPLTGDT